MSRNLSAYPSGNQSVRLAINRSRFRTEYPNPLNGGLADSHARLWIPQELLDSDAKLWPQLVKADMEVEE